MQIMLVGKELTCTLKSLGSPVTLPTVNVVVLQAVSATGRSHFCPSMGNRNLSWLFSKALLCDGYEYFCIPGLRPAQVPLKGSIDELFCTIWYYLCWTSAMEIRLQSIQST